MMTHVERLSRTVAQKKAVGRDGYPHITITFSVFLLNCSVIFWLTWSLQDFYTGMIALLGVSAFWITFFLETVYVQSATKRKVELKAWMKRVYIGKLIKFLFSFSLLAIAFQSFPEQSQTILFSYLLSIGFCVATLSMHDQRGL